MTSQSSALGGMLNHLAGNWGRMVWLMLPYVAIYAALLTVQGVAVSRMDLWITVETMQEANRTAIWVAAISQFLRFCVIGAAALRLAKEWPSRDMPPASGRFLLFWLVVSLALALALMAVDLWRQDLRETSGEDMTGETMRSLWLSSIYVQLVVFYLAARFWFGASHFATGGVAAAWRATTTLRSLVLFVALLVLMLVVDDVLVAILSYVPLVAPFWFVPDELSSHRYLVGQGTRIAAESIGVLFYAGFWLAVDRIAAGAQSSSESPLTSPQ